MDIAEAVAFIADHHRAVLATTRADGSTQMAPVAAAVDSAGRVLVSTRATAYKTAHVRRTGRAALLVMNDGFFGQWVQVEGPVAVVELPEALDVLVDYYRRVSGEHPDWDDYRQAMVAEQRVVLRMTVDRAGPNRAG